MLVPSYNGQPQLSHAHAPYYVNVVTPCFDAWHVRVPGWLVGSRLSPFRCICCPPQLPPVPITNEQFSCATTGNAQGTSSLLICRRFFFHVALGFEEPLQCLCLCELQPLQCLCLHEVQCASSRAFACTTVKLSNLETDCYGRHHLRSMPPIFSPIFERSSTSVHGVQTFALFMCPLSLACSSPYFNKPIRELIADFAPTLGVATGTFGAIWARNK